jgi:hypothetical protein
LAERFSPNVQTSSRPTPLQICVDRYQDNRFVKEFSGWDQYPLSSLCSTHLSPKSPRYRSLSERAHSTTIDLWLSLFPRGGFRRDKSAMKLQTVLDLRGSIPTDVQLMRAAKSYCFRDGEQEIQYGHGRLAPTHVSHGSDTDVRLLSEFSKELYVMIAPQTGGSHERTRSLSKIPNVSRLPCHPRGWSWSASGA